MHETQLVLSGLTQPTKNDFSFRHYLHGGGIYEKVDGNCYFNRACFWGLHIISADGVIYTNVSGGISAGGGPVAYTKVGKAEASSIMGMVATGDASIQTAVKNGNIKTIKYVDYHTERILGVVGKYATTVYGD